MASDDEQVADSEKGPDTQDFDVQVEVADFVMDTEGNIIEGASEPSDVIVLSEDEPPEEDLKQPPMATGEFDRTMAGGVLTAEDLDVALSGIESDDVVLEDKQRPESTTTRTERSDTRVDEVSSSENTTSSSLDERILRKLDEADSRPDEDPMLGMVLGNRFEVLQKIGEGGMGAVYRARQKGIEREVAIKVLLGDVARNKTLVRRFHLEALAISKLKHPNTIQTVSYTHLTLPTNREV